MSFSSEVKKEIGTINNLAKKEQIKYELIGYLLSSNCEMQKVGRKTKLKFKTESDYNINRYSKILTNLDIKHDIEMSGNFFVIISDVPEIEEIIEKESFIEVSNSKEIIEKSDEIKKCIIRGMFLGSGSINNPENKYHFEISFSSEKNLELATALIAHFQIKNKKLKTKDKLAIYIKEGEEISKMLALMGANKAVMKFEDIRIEREMRGKINRLVNCETANLNKTLNAAVEQIEAIERLKKKRKFGKLNKNLKEMAKLRLEFPDLSLIELGKKLNPPIGKSAVNYRLKKIIEIANEFEKNN